MEGNENTVGLQTLQPAVVEKRNFNVTIIKQTLTSITVDWHLIEEAEVYEIEKYTRRLGWQVVAWCSEGPTTLQHLDENFAYRFRIKALRLDTLQRQYQPLCMSCDFVASTTAMLPSTLCLFRALKKGQQFLVKRMLRVHPGLLEYPGPNGYLPLLNAIVFGEYVIVDILLTAGANVHQGNPLNGRTPLHLAFYYGRLAVARILLNKRADLEAIDVNGMTPSHFAIDGNQWEVLKYAIEYGANIEACDACGWTLLLRAVVMEADVSILKLLITSGANLLVQDKSAQNCMDLARLYKNVKAAEFLTDIQKHIKQENECRNDT